MKINFINFSTGEDWTVTSNFVPREGDLIRQTHQYKVNSVVLSSDLKEAYVVLSLAEAGYNLIPSEIDVKMQKKKKKKTTKKVT